MYIRVCNAAWGRKHCNGRCGLKMLFNGKILLQGEKKEEGGRKRGKEEGRKESRKDGGWVRGCEGRKV